MCLTACAAPDQPIPQPPAIKTVTVYRDLPADLTTPCAKSPWRRSDIRTDTDLMGRLSVETARADCNADKLVGIGKVQVGQ